MAAASSSASAADKSKQGECVKVVIRCRPMSQQEQIDGRENIVEFDSAQGVARLRRPGTRDYKDFTFDAVYDPNTKQQNFYDDTGYAIVENVMDGYNGTIFAYGQTGTGKTFTMLGAEDPPDLKGVIPRTFEHIFKNINITSGSGKRFLVRASYLEIYNEEIRDLLSKNPKAKLELKDHPDGGVYVKDLSNLIVKNVPDLEQVMLVGQRNRSVASTLMNNESSRSHSIFTITIETAETGVDGQEHIRVGKMNMVDLAGSERQSKTGATGETLKEATKINMSLSALGNVISALVDAKTSFIPYRDSKLTRLLQDSLGGNTKTVMCANVGPVDYNYDETMSTLRYAYRAKSIKNKPRINEDPKDAMIREFQDEIMRLKMKLQEQAAKGGGGSIPRQPIVRPDGTVVEQEVIEEKEIVEVETVVENEVLVEKVVNRGVNEEDMALIRSRVDAERAEIEAQVAEERRLIEQQQNVADEEKKKLLDDLSERKRRREEEAQQQQVMLSRLNAMQEKMLVGSQVMEKAMQQEQELKRAEMEVEERRRQEQRMKEELEQQMEEKLTLEDKYSSAADQVQKMTAKLEKLWHRHKQTQQEIQDLQKEFQQEREDMLETIRDLRQELKLVCLTIDNFVPMEQYQQIVERAQYDESADEWVIAGVELAGNRLRPISRKKDRAGRETSAVSALLRGNQPDPYQDPNEVALMNERPNVYYVYTQDGGVMRAETRPSGSPQKVQKAQRTRSASGRPGTANRKGRGVKSSTLGATGTSTMTNFLHSPEPEGEDVLTHQFPKARGLVRAS
mmetsp:Transcript_68132/g.163501  ORF Transcript_68132/g.163501 Transcript_68132/m.163501 type:complete len:793 (-) Transcript_68132:202-2580(-)